MKAKEHKGLRKKNVFKREHLLHTTQYLKTVMHFLSLTLKNMINVHLIRGYVLRKMNA